MKITIVGTRGIPANYGGFETLAEELSARLVKKGYEVTVYCRSNNIKYEGTQYRGVRLVILPTISHKYLDTIANAFLSSIHCMFQGYDVALFCNAATALFTIFPRLAGQKVAINVDGIERKRKKWNAFGRAWYLVGEYLSTKLPNEIVSDAKVIQEYYKEKYGKDSTFIAYGCETKHVATTAVLKKYALEKNGYFLYISRLEPENNAHLVIKAFEKVKTEKKLVIVGDAPYSTDYIKSLHATKDERIIFTGFVFGEGYSELQQNAYAYIHATEIGGTHPALIESMYNGNCLIVNSTPENIEVGEDAVLYYKMNDVDDCSMQMQIADDDPGLAAEKGKQAHVLAIKKFSWDTIVKQYEELFWKMAGNGK